MIEWLRSADLEQASAETHSLRALDVGDSDRIDLLYSSTDEGRLCAEVLAKHYQSCTASVKTHRIAELGYGAERFTRGLKGLVDVSLRLIRDGRERGEDSIICATGGFKAEIAFLNLLGALLGIEVVYMHEQFRSLVRLPRLPLRWDEDFVMQHEDFFRWIDEEPRRSDDVLSRLKAAPELSALVESHEDGNSYLTVAGDLLFKAAKERQGWGPRATWPDADPRPPDEKNHVSTAEHHRPPGWEQFVHRLCRIDCVSSVRYDEAARNGPRVRILDAAQGAIAVRFERSGQALFFRVETTARGSEQCELVARHLRSLAGS
jgi:putative CRISPR-associated protein (TIGR02619 family)